MRHHMLLRHGGRSSSSSPGRWPGIDRLVPRKGGCLSLLQATVASGATTSGSCCTAAGPSTACTGPGIEVSGCVTAALAQPCESPSLAT